MDSFVYVLVNGNEWEDIVIFLSREEAISESVNNPNARVEIFSKENNKMGYTPTYNYYQNGILIQNS